jgi:hypothetical protein
MITPALIARLEEEQQEEDAHTHRDAVALLFGEGGGSRYLLRRYDVWYRSVPRAVQWQRLQAAQEAQGQGSSPGSPGKPGRRLEGAAGNGLARQGGRLGAGMQSVMEIGEKDGEEERLVRVEVPIDITDGSKGTSCVAVLEGLTVGEGCEVRVVAVASLVTQKVFRTLRLQQLRVMGQKEAATGSNLSSSAASSSSSSTVNSSTVNVNTVNSSTGGQSVGWPQSIEGVSTATVSMVPGRVPDNPRSLSGRCGIPSRPYSRL